jgi:Flp pilus assembly protein TadD
LREACSLAVHGQPAPSRAAEAGWDALEEGDGEKAAAALSQALAGHPREPALLYGAGAAAHLAGRDSEACELLRKAIEIEPRLTPASALLGQIVDNLGDVAAAIRT